MASNSWLIYALLSALFAGLVAIFGKLGVKDMDSTLATTLRAFVMAAMLFVLCLFRFQNIQLTNISPRSWLFIVLAGFAGALSWLFYFQALKLQDASRVAPIDRLSVVVTITLAYLFLGEKVSGTVLLGASLVLAGAILIVRG
jgi:transporter family protein